jgi:hypothetical protein
MITVEQLLQAPTITEEYTATRQALDVAGILDLVDADDPEAARDFDRDQLTEALRDACDGSDTYATALKRCRATLAAARKARQDAIADLNPGRVVGWDKRGRDEAEQHPAIVAAREAKKAADRERIRAVRAEQAAAKRAAVETRTADVKPGEGIDG